MPTLTRVTAGPDGFYRRGALVDASAVIDLLQTVPGSFTTGARLPYQQLTPWPGGDWAPTVAGTVTEGAWVKGYVRPQAPNCVLRNSIVSGRTPGTFVKAGLVDASNGDNLLLEDVEISCLAPDGTDNTNYWTNAFTGTGKITGRRLDVHDVVDCFGQYGDGNVFEHVWAHDFALSTDDQDHDDDPYFPFVTHDDVAQVKRGSGTFRGIFGDARFSLASADGAAFHAANPQLERKYAKGFFLKTQGGNASITLEGIWLRGGEVALRLDVGTAPYNASTINITGPVRIIPDQRLAYGHHLQAVFDLRWGTVTGRENITYWNHTDTPAALRGQPLPWVIDSNGNPYSRLD